MTTPTPDFRARCKELIEMLSKHQDRLEETYHPDATEAKEYEAGFRVLERARADLATPEPPPPTDEELMALAVAVFEDPYATDKDYARAVLERWGK
jgi:hypothetical protein